ncbi:MAG: Hsp20/alpha crystallin family protein [Tepidisphaeraceae bacterium]|jgi:HSP20 family protein
MIAVRLADKSYRQMPSSTSKFLEQFQSKGYYSFAPNEQWTPNVNLYETESAYMVCVDLAGVEKDKIDLEIVQNRLRIRGHRAVPTTIDPTSTEPTPARIRVHLMEIDHGEFARDVELPANVHADEISARYHSGMLWIELPKRA